MSAIMGKKHNLGLSQISVERREELSVQSFSAPLELARLLLWVRPPGVMSIALDADLRNDSGNTNQEVYADLTGWDGGRSLVFQKDYFVWGSFWGDLAVGGSGGWWPAEGSLVGPGPPAQFLRVAPGEHELVVWMRTGDDLAGGPARIRNMKVTALMLG